MQEIGFIQQHDPHRDGFRRSAKAVHFDVAAGGLNLSEEYQRGKQHNTTRYVALLFHLFAAKDHTALQKLSKPNLITPNYRILPCADYAASQFLTSAAAKCRIASELRVVPSSIIASEDRTIHRHEFENNAPWYFVAFCCSAAPPVLLLLCAGIRTDEFLERQPTLLINNRAFA